MQPLPFVVGRGRSGTTLVRAILDSHPDMAIPDETHFIMALARNRRLYEHGSGFRTERFLDDLVAQQGFLVLEMSRDRAHGALVKSQPASYPDAIRAVFAEYARSRGKTRYGDKTPLHVLSIRALSDLFPEARFVHVIRDGRDVALSYLDVSWGASTMEEAAILWRRAVRTGRRQGRRLGSDRYHEIRYEALLEDPETIVRNVCGFLDLDFDASMLRYNERAHEVAGKMGAPETRQNLYLPFTKGLRDWRSQMDLSQLARFEVLAGDVLDELGYERAVSRPGLRPRVEARRRWLDVQARRAVDRGRKLRRRLRTSSHGSAAALPSRTGVPDRRE